MIAKEEKRKKDKELKEKMQKMRELDLKMLNGSQSRGNDLSAFTNRLRKGDFTFDDNGKPIVVKRKNVNNLPDMAPQLDIKVKAS